MLEQIGQWVGTSDWMSWRELIRIVLLSGLFTLVCVLAFPRNAPSRRILLMISVTALAVLPWMLWGSWATWYLPVDVVPKFSLSEGLPDVLIWTWGVVAFLGLVNYAYGVAIELRRIHHLRCIEDEQLHATVDELARALGVDSPKLRLGGMACSTSLVTPTIVLPARYIGWNEQVLRSVLAHELVHISRRDDLWLLLCRALLLVYWWMPWISYLYAGFVRSIEESCDDKASEQIGHPVVYLEALAGVAGEEIVARKHTPPLSVTSMHEHHLVGRIGRFSQLRELELDTSGVYWCVVGVLCVVVLLAGIEPVARGVDSVQGIPDAHVRSEALRLASNAPLFPEIYHYNQFSAEVSAPQQNRLRTPAYEPPVIYPGQALRQELEGSVTVGFYVSSDGGVTQPQIVSSSHYVFEAVALRAVIDSRYPAEVLAVGRRNWDLDLALGFPSHDASVPSSLGSVMVHRHFRFSLHKDL
ncbi:MAG: M56 family metallopeptidase [Pseudomonadota bacterium]